MDSIFIHISKDEFDYIRKALQDKHTSLISKLDRCEFFSSFTEEDIENTTEEDVRAEVELLRKQINDLPRAPHGLKKDGTPKKKIGRPRKTK